MAVAPFLPPDAQYKLVEFGGMLPPKGSLSNKEWLQSLRNASIGSGEYFNNQFQGEFTIDSSVARVDDGWRFQIYSFGSESQSQYTFTENWPAEMGRVEQSDIWPGTQAQLRAGRADTLAVFGKASQRTTIGRQNGQPPSTDPAEGIALWLEPPPLNKP